MPKVTVPRKRKSDSQSNRGMVYPAPRNSMPVEFDPLEPLKKSMMDASSAGEAVMTGVPRGTGYSAGLMPSTDEVNANNLANLRQTVGLPSASTPQEAQRQQMRGLLGVGPISQPSQLPPMAEGMGPNLAFKLREMGYSDREILQFARDIQNQLSKMGEGRLGR